MIVNILYHIAHTYMYMYSGSNRRYNCTSIASHFSLKFVHISSTGVGAMRLVSKLPWSKNAKGNLYLMQERMRFHHRTAFLVSLARQSGSRRSSMPSRSLMTLRSTEGISHCPYRWKCQDTQSQEGSHRARSVS